jgi:hypothetical protein
MAGQYIKTPMAGQSSRLARVIPHANVFRIPRATLQFRRIASQGDMETGGEPLPFTQRSAILRS